MAATADPPAKARPRRSAKARAKFQAERRALGKMQVHFEFQQALLKRVRMAAAAENLGYSDYVRKAVGLPYAKIQRPRISLSFSAEDLRHLARRYGRPADQPAALKQCVMEEIHRRLGEDHDAAGP